MDERDMIARFIIEAIVPYLFYEVGPVVQSELRAVVIKAVAGLRFSPAIQLGLPLHNEDRIQRLLTVWWRGDELVVEFGDQEAQGG